jgi:hypothetical protein
MNENLFFALFWIMMGVSLLWLFCVRHLFKVIEKEYPDKFKAMGSPSLFWDNTPKAVWMLFEFLIKREYIKLKNPRLNILVSFMTVMFIFFIIGFFFLAFNLPHR